MKKKDQNKNIQSKKEKVNFGFYNSLLLFIFFSYFYFENIIFFTQDFIIFNFPITEFYLNYFFESIRNIFEIWKDLVTY